MEFEFKKLPNLERVVAFIKKHVDRSIFSYVTSIQSESLPFHSIAKQCYALNEIECIICHRSRMPLTVRRELRNSSKNSINIKCK